jgi:hypothetical protein
MAPGPMSGMIRSHAISFRAKSAVVFRNQPAAPRSACSRSCVITSCHAAMRNVARAPGLVTTH